MNNKQLDAWRSRKMEVRILDLCAECQTLKDDVKEREYFTGYLWARRFEVKKTCCAACFEIAKKAQQQEYDELTG
ncbi:hypothetical protein [Burkholderia gladioli]|uniref:hypothetical protein n=1 Tax=Burkholderia gladioli TaxID=28095 RepID=UPI0016419BCD|nr:hypothetical protein [Burkholderia gladioli]